MLDLLARFVIVTKLLNFLLNNFAFVLGIHFHKFAGSSSCIMFGWCDVVARAVPIRKSYNMSSFLVLIDDDDDDLDLLRDAILEFDPFCICVSYTSPVAALDNLAANSRGVPDVVFTDVNMPALTGQEVVRQLRLQQRFDTVLITDYRCLLTTIFDAAYSCID